MFDGGLAGGDARGVMQPVASTVMSARAISDRRPTIHRVYSAPVAVATYPGTVSPLRGLDPFGEAERDVWQGRETERDELARMVTADGFRAGLLYGEPGVGKTSLVRAGLIPHLRDHGVVALACEDVSQPAASFANGLSAFGIQPNPQEAPTAFIARAVANAVAGQHFVFIVDDVDLACGDERVTGEIAELFAKVVSRSAGRARFLFVAASERMHVLGALERRTGSLFPPSNRYELTRLTRSAATAILDRVLALSGIAADPPLADAVVQGLSHGGVGVLAADLQIAAMAMRDLRLATIPALQKFGGGTELLAGWLHDAALATGNERSALRLCAELATGTHGARHGDDVIRRINLDTNYAQSAFGVLEQRGIIARGDAGGGSWMLRHEVLQLRVRELTAPARAAARRAFDLLGSKTQTRSRLTLRELQALRHEGIAPVTAAEIDVVRRSKRYYAMVAGGIAAIPIVIAIAMIASMRGHVFFEIQPRAGGDRVLVRSGRAGLAAFGWLPGSRYGKYLADTGLTQTMIAPEAWKKIEARDLGSPRASWANQLPGLMAPQLAGLVDYATTGADASLQELAKAAQDPEDLAELLTELRPIARGTPAEVALVEAALAKQPPPVQRAAVAAAGAAAQRRDVYQDTLVQALTSNDPELRRIAFSAVRGLGERGQALFRAAIERVNDSNARRDLMVAVAVASTDEGPSPASAAGVLADPDASPPLRERAKDQLKAALAQDPQAAAGALVSLVAQDKAPADARVWAIEELRDLDSLPKLSNLLDATRAAFNSRSVAVRAAALPLYAKVDPELVTNELGPMLEDKKQDKALRAASALAWGEVATVNHGAAENALDKLLKEDDEAVRAAAASAAGKLGRTYQDRLVKMVKAENYGVRIGAAEGLAWTALTGGNVGVAIDGIAQLWREKGRPRRDAVKIWAHFARRKPFPNVVEYLASAAKLAEDPSLHSLAVDGLCNAALAGSADARRALAKSDDDPAVDVRRLVIQCVADGPDPAKNGGAIAQHLVRDPDTEIRANAARVLALTATKGKVATGVGDAIVQLLDDPDRDVRVIGIRALGELGADAPKSSAAAMAKRFERGDDAEKLALLRAAKLVGAEDLIGAATTDSSSSVRIEAIDAALAANVRAKQTLTAAIADADPQVRKAALERLAAQKDKLDPKVRDEALALAVRDPDPELRQLALTTIARVAPKEAVIARLHRSLSSRAERERAQAAAAAIGLVDREPAEAVQLLEPLLDDPSHDVRVAMLPALATAYAKTNDAKKLADLLADSEDHAMRRLVVAAAFVTLAKTDAGLAASQTAIKGLADSGPPMASMIAKLVAGLIAGKADGIAFLQELVP
jgi:HEAT repeat protein